MGYIIVYDVIIIFRKDFLRNMNFQKEPEERKQQIRK